MIIKKWNIKIVSDIRVAWSLKNEKYKLPLKNPLQNKTSRPVISKLTQELLSINGLQ